MSSGNVKIDLAGGILHLIDEVRTFGALAQAQPAMRGFSKKSPRTPQEWAQEFGAWLELRYGKRGE